MVQQIKPKRDIVKRSDTDDLWSIYLLLVVLLVVMVPTAALGTPTSKQGGNFMVSVAGTAVGSVSHQIDLKVTQLPGGQLSEVSGFIFRTEDVVQVKQGENLIVATSPDLKTHQVTVRNIQGIPTRTMGLYRLNSFVFCFYVH
jgi:hypothetical protein